MDTNKESMGLFRDEPTEDNLLLAGEKVEGQLEEKEKKEPENKASRYILTGSILIVLLLLGGMLLANALKIGVSEKIIVFNGFRYEGEIRKGNPKGEGLLVFAENEQYYSDRIGTIDSPDFTIIAEMKNGLPDGKGFLINRDGSIYAGDFREGFMHGHGIFIWSDGSIYEGGYVKNKKSGEGTVVSESGLKYIGGFKDDKMHGEGILISSHGMEKEVTWVEGKLQ